MFKPGSVVVGPDEGISLWQPMPSRGYVNLNLTPDNMPYDTFVSGIQVLPPGCYVREHGHTINHELIFVYKGTGEVTINGKKHEIGPGCTVMFADNDLHIIENTGDEDMELFRNGFDICLPQKDSIGRPIILSSFPRMEFAKQESMVRSELTNRVDQWIV